MWNLQLKLMMTLTTKATPTRSRCQMSLKICKERMITTWKATTTAAEVPLMLGSAGVAKGAVVAAAKGAVRDELQEQLDAEDGGEGHIEGKEQRLQGRILRVGARARRRVAQSEADAVGEYRRVHEPLETPMRHKEIHAPSHARGHAVGCGCGLHGED